MKILIVDDDEDSRVYQKNVLEAKGHEIVTAANGKDGLDKAVAAPPDMIISDILMPEMDGYALCRAIKKRPETRAVPFVFYTATYTDPRDERFAEELGASRFILKPADASEFLNHIETVLKEHAEARLPVRESALKDEAALEQSHTEVLTRKLDKKIRDLEAEHRKMLASEQRYRRLVEALRDNYFFYTRDVSGAFSYVSPSIHNVLGYTPEAFLSDADTVWRRKPDAALYGDAGSGESQGMRTIEIEMVHKNGEIHQLVLTENFVKDTGDGPLIIEGIAHDVTTQKKMEKERKALTDKLRQAQKMEAIGTLAGGIAHDFNNILTPIIGYAELVLLYLEKGNPGRPHQEQIIKAANRAKELVQQILTFSRQTEQEQRPLFFQTIVKEAIKFLRSTIPTTIDIEYEIRECSPVLADATQLHQIVMNLCTNAYQAMKTSGGKLRIALNEIEIRADDFVTHLDLAPGKYVRLEISDTGCGMDADTIARIFDPYYTTKPQEEGTGLGLSVVHGIIKSHGGYINVYSEPGEGATFHVYLPVIRMAAESDKIQEPAVPLQRGHEHILLVDDDVNILDMEKQMLEILGYHVTAMSESEAALAEFEKNSDSIDLLITDMTMPKLTGLELLKKARVMRPDLPVIVCSGFSDRIDADKARSLGIQAYVMKPLIMRDFAQIIRKALSA